MNSMTKQYLTENASGLSEAQGWVIRQSSNVVNVAPPRVSFDFKTAPFGWDSWESLSLINFARVKNIDNDVHNQLLEQSLSEYGEVWRRLALR